MEEGYKRKCGHITAPSFKDPQLACGRLVGKYAIGVGGKKVLQGHI
jgi:hypothetical protein